MIPESIVEAMARAIARAEGFFVSDSLAQRANNPGNLKLGDIGLGTIRDKTVFPTVEQGWTALQRQIRFMLTGTSQFYTPAMSILEVAAIYTGRDNPLAWATTVASALGVSIQTKLADLIAVAPNPERSRNTLLLLGLAALAGAIILSLRD
jgi:hypothetical protein